MRKPSPRLFAVLAPLSFCAALTGCYGTIAKRTADFSDKAAPALVETRAAYALVETTHARRGRVNAIAAYETTSFDQVALHASFGRPPDLQARMDVLDLLHRYIQSLADVSGDQAFSGIDAASKDAAEATTAIAMRDLPALVGATSTSTETVSTSSATPGSSAAPKVSVTQEKITTPVLARGSAGDSGPAALAIAALGRVIVERKRARALPGILESADPAVTTLCELLRRDFGDPETSGLRKVLRIDYEGIETAEDAAIRDHPDGYSYPERRAAIDALYKLLAEQQAADATLEQTDQALLTLEKTHTALTRTARDKRAPGFHALLAELVIEGEQLATAEKAAADPTPASKKGGK